MDGFGLLSAMFVYNDAVGHVTHLWPPDWLLPHIAASRGTAGIVRLFGFPRVGLHGSRSYVSTLFWFCPVIRV